MSIQSVNPATGDVVETYEETSPKEIERILAGAQAAFAEWRNTPFTARARSMRNAAESVFRDAGFPRGLFATVLVGSSAVAGLIADRRVVAATLTGSDHAGSKVAEQAGRELKKTVLELGGSDPFIVLPDADLAATAKMAAEARLVNSGQS